MSLGLREYQHEIVDFILDNPRCNLFVPMGGGKTVSTLTAIDLLSLVEDVLPVLVVAPLRVATSTWPTEIEKFPHLRHLRVSVICGEASERRAALRKPADIYCVNYEQLSWLEEYLGNDWPFKMIVADECSKLKGFRLRQGTKRAKALARYAHSKTSRYVGLTGTPASNGLQDLWGVTWFVDQGVRLGRTFQAFRDRWFQAVPGSQGYQQIKPMPFAQEQIQDKLRDVCLTIDLGKYLDIREPIVNVIRVDLPAKARKLYRDMEREMFMALESGVTIEAFNAASKTIKCLALTSGFVYTDDSASQWQEVHDVKLQALGSIIEEAAGMPVLVAYHFRADLARLLKAFPQGRHLDKNPQTIVDWNDGKIPVLFAHPASAGHGISLQHGSNIIAFYSISWNLEEHLQIIERLGPTRQAQSGYDRPVFVHYVVAHETVDDLVLARLDSKKSVQEVLMEAMKRKRL